MRAKRFRFRPVKRKRPGRQGQNDARRKRRITSAGLIVDEDVMTPMDQVFNMTMRMVRTGKEQGEQCA